MSKKSAVIITYYRSENYGAFLQAFSMQEFLRKNNIDAYILDYKSKTEKIISKTVGILAKPKKETAEKIEYRSKMTDRILEQQTQLRLTDKNKKSDVTILGSDEIWNVKNYRAAHDSFLFKKNKNSKKTISYAACSGTSTKKHLMLFPYAVPGIMSLDNVSVRDEQTEKMVRSLGRKDAVRVLDPTFLLDFTPYLPEAPYKKPYLFVYSYGLTDDQIAEIKNVSQERNLPVIATGTNCEWADYNPAPTPFEWVSLIKNAEAVITTTFHGTVFAIQQNKNFAVYHSGSSKIQSVLREFGLLDRKITQWKSLNMLLDSAVNYEDINRLIEEKKLLSKQFLLNQFSDNKNENNYNILSKREINFGTSKYYAVRHKSEKVRWASRSGGAFTALSDVVLQNGGVVYGCSLNENFEAVHTRAETVEERDKLRGSKYVQSNLSVTLSSILEDLQKNRVVMFVGTPCQVDAVKTMAKQKKLNSNLITVDFICHGVPSPKVFKEYISQFKNVTEFNFRDKNKFGWKAHKESIVSDGKKIFSDKYTKLYYQNYCVRPCCHECPYSQIERFSDITISDCWGIEKAAPKFNTDDSGVSMIIVNTSTGSECLKEATEDMEICQINPNLIKQPVLESGGWGASNPNAKRKEFWKDFNEKGIAFVCEKYSVESSSAKIKKTLSSKSYKIRFKIKKMMGRN